jgi:hypothetical protein
MNLIIVTMQHIHNVNLNVECDECFAANGQWAMAMPMRNANGNGNAQCQWQCQCAMPMAMPMVGRPAAREEMKKSACQVFSSKS